MDGWCEANRFGYASKEMQLALAALERVRLQIKELRRVFSERPPVFNIFSKRSFRLNYIKYFIF